MMENDLEKLRTEVRNLKLVVAILAALLLVLAGASIRKQPGANGVLRAKGLVIEDDAGRERILLGAPIPAAKNRVRTDPARVAAAWAKKFPPEYMEWYKEYHNDMSGMLILDVGGFDRIAIGSPVPDPNNGKRVAPGNGVVMND